MTAVPARDAASLLVVSDRPPFRVLMGRRPASARFMPGVYVFPGGAVESGDAAVTVRHAFDDTDVHRMQAADADHARALGVAALRETFEETGLVCACGDDVVDWADVAAGQGLPDLSQLRYLGRALTPTVSSIRFHARFFVVRATVEAMTPRASPELSDPCWVDLGAPGTLPIPGVTRFMLDELSRWLADEGESTAPPFYHWHDGAFRVERDDGR